MKDYETIEEFMARAGRENEALKEMLALVAEYVDLGELGAARFPTVVAFMGFKGAGKSTAAELAYYMLRRGVGPAGVEVAMRSFAKRLKILCETILGLGKSQTGGDRKEIVDPRYGKTPRQIMQEIGSFFRDHYGTDFWVEALDRTRMEDEITVIDDLRYPNEAAWARAQGGVVIGVRGRTVLSDTHESEVTMAAQWEEMIDYEIENTGSIEDLARAVRDVLRQIAGGE